MTTPVVDFVKSYAETDHVRMHMPGHKGDVLLGPETLDITEIQGAGELYTAGGPIGEGEANTASLFGTARSCWVTEGSSQCIRAMLALVTQYGNHGRTILAARNAHRAFLTACALLDLRVEWLWPEEYSLCSCPVTPVKVEEAIGLAMEKPSAVYLTSPDYLGRLQDIAGIAAVCHAKGIPLLVDNAHGAYLHFLKESIHPIQLGADLVCDSAHKTLPALTGCAYLHISKTAPEAFHMNAKQSLAVFGSTSPSWLLLQSLDEVNLRLATDFRSSLSSMQARLSTLRERLSEKGWRFYGDEPLKLTVDALAAGYTGEELAECLRREGIEPEYADPDYCVLMISPYQDGKDIDRLEAALWHLPMRSALAKTGYVLEKPVKTMEIREALFSCTEVIPIESAEGRILAAPTLSCPPAISVVVSGERIGNDAIQIMQQYGTETVSVVAKQCERN